MKNRRCSSEPPDNESLERKQNPCNLGSESSVSSLTSRTDRPYKAMTPRTRIGSMFFVGVIAPMISLGCSARGEAHPGPAPSAGAAPRAAPAPTPPRPPLCGGPGARRGSRGLPGRGRQRDLVRPRRPGPARPARRLTPDRVSRDARPASAAARALDRRLPAQELSARRHRDARGRHATSSRCGPATAPSSRRCSPPSAIDRGGRDPRSRSRRHPRSARRPDRREEDRAQRRRLHRGLRHDRRTRWATCRARWACAPT